MISSGVTVIRVREKESVKSNAEMKRQKRDLEAFDRTGGVYINAIAQPRGIPDEFKATQEVGGGVEALFVPTAGISKNFE